MVAETGYGTAHEWETGNLSNSGERITLVNNSDRLMDTIQYRDDGAWSMVADGSGASLAKIDRTTASGPAANWTFSLETGRRLSTSL